MYDYRSWSAAQRETALTERRAHNYPLHSPPHLQGNSGFRLVTGTCYEHKPILNSSERLAWFENQLLSFLQNKNTPCVAWVILPNHYHALLRISDIKSFTNALGKLHGRTSYEMNHEDKLRGRKCWYRCQDRVMRSERHYHTTINYIHNNPVKHGLVNKWGDWPYSSFHHYLGEKGREWLKQYWLEYPVLNYGEKWDV